MGSSNNIIDIRQGYEGASYFASDANFEVQRANHFEILINLDQLRPALTNVGEYQKHIRLCCTQASIPNIRINPTALRHGNEYVNVAGSPTYENTRISVYDTIGSNMADLLQQWFWRVFNPNDHHMGLVSSYKCSANLFLYSPDCSVIRIWELYGVFPTSLSFGELSAEQQGTPMSIQMELAVDRSVLKMQGQS